MTDNHANTNRLYFGDNLRPYEVTGVPFAVEVESSGVNWGMIAMPKGDMER